MGTSQNDQSNSGNGGWGTGEELASGYSNTGDAAKDSVSNSYSRGYGQGDAAKETGSSAKSTSDAWHTARDDYQKDEGKDDRHKTKWW